MLCHVDAPAQFTAPSHLLAESGAQMEVAYRRFAYAEQVAAPEAIDVRGMVAGRSECRDDPGVPMLLRVAETRVCAVMGGWIEGA